MELTLLQSALLADLTGELNMPVRLQRLLVSLQVAYACDALALLRLDGECLCPQALVGLPHEVHGRRLRLDEQPRLAALLAQREALLFAADCPWPDPFDGLLHADAAGLPPAVHDCLGISLYLDGRLWGVLTLDSRRAGTFDERARQRLQRDALLVEVALRVSRLEREARSLRQARSLPALREPHGEDGVILGQHPPLLALLDELAVVAAADLPVLLQGETGVGKELFARWLHAHSPRAGQPLIHVNCAALPESLVESELFGHSRGAFSGAGQERAGRFEAAHGGTLLLDEVGELPLNVQAKLLRALQNGEIQRLGEDRPRHVDVRVIAASNRQLHDEVREQRFRADLYHRLSAYPVHIPPLRERGQDILLLAGHFLELNRARLGLRGLSLSTAAEQALLAHAWPGNVRELEHVISRAALKALSQAASRSALLCIEAPWLGLDGGQSRLPAAAPALPEARALPLAALREQVDECQRQAIRAALQAHPGNWAAAARLLQLDPSNLRKLARRLGVQAV